MNSTKPHDGITRLAGFLYAGLGFTLTHLIFVVLILFLLDWIPYPSIDGTPHLGLAGALIADIALIAVFGLQHTGMARSAIKRLVTRLVPELLERATYVHFANVALAALILLWQPIPATIWKVDNGLLAGAIFVLFVFGWAFSFFGSILIDHLQLLGMRQAWSWLNGRDYTLKPFQNHWLYDHVRHPIQLALIVAFWATPHMTVGHLVFSAGLTLYILVGTHFEEKDLVATFGEAYAGYRKRVPALFPMPWRR